MIRVALLSVVPPDIEGISERVTAGEYGTALFGSFSTVETPLIKGLMERSNIELHVVTLERGRSGVSVKEVGQHAIHRIGVAFGTGMITGWIPRARQVRRYLSAAIGPDVAHGMRTDHGYATMAAASGFPNIITIQGFLGDSPHQWWMNPVFRAGTASERWTIRRAENVVAISDHVRRRITPRASGRIHRIPNMVDDRFFSVAPELGGRTIVYVGRITPEKGLLDVLRSAALVDDCGLDWLVVGGASGPDGLRYLEKCRQAARRLKSKVEFLGWVPNHQLPAVLQRARCGVFPYSAAYETFGISVAEMMAAGRPTIVYDFGPLPEHVADGESGFVVPVGDIHALASKIAELASSDEHAARMGATARNLALRYSQSQVLSSYEELYEMVASAGVPRAGE